MNTVYLSTGSNIGNSHAHLEQAITFMEERIGKVTARSAVYKTEPWGNKDQQDFLNQVLQAETALTPRELLNAVLQIELDMGRNRIHKWEPRIIDIDILFYDDEIVDSEHLRIPHPLMHERRFTLMPLNEIAPDLEHPVLHKKISQLLAECKDTSEVIAC